MAEETGQRVGDYEVLSLLGSGGMGRVYKVRSVISNREEAMKILLPDFASEPELAARFMAEIRTLAGLDHPNITQLRTAFQIQNQFVMVMEYVEGTTLDKFSAQLQLDQVIDYSQQVLAALSYAHGKGVTHRDIKPANIMITTHGVVKLMDFGIAKSTTDLNLTRPGTTMGSIYYMSPEQVRGGAVDGRTDIYSFGVTLYEMLTGRKPFEAETSYSVLNAQLNEAPAPPAQWNPALSPALNDIVLRAMAKDPAARFQTAEEFRGALKALRGEQKAAPSPGAVVAPIPFPVSTSAPGFSPTAPQFSQHTVLDTGSVPPVQATQPGQPVQGFTPVAVGAAPVQGQGKSNRPLWIALGALAAVIAVAAAFAVLPHFFATHAGQKTVSNAATTQTASNTPPADTTATPPPPTDSQPVTPTGSTGTAAPTAAPTSTSTNSAASNPTPPTSASSGPTKPTPFVHPVSSASAAAAGQHSAPPSIQTPPAATSSAPPVAAGASQEEIRHARDRYMDLDARADTVRSGIDTLRRQQQAQGYDMRGDMVGALNRMNNSLGEADRALNEGNLDVARDYMDRANNEMQKLESFLGR
jgi:serine/threonine-protein kinase